MDTGSCLLGSSFKTFLVLQNRIFDNPPSNGSFAPSWALVQVFLDLPLRIAWLFRIGSSTSIPAMVCFSFVGTNSIFLGSSFKACLVLQNWIFHKTSRNGSFTTSWALIQVSLDLPLRLAWFYRIGSPTSLPVMVSLLLRGHWFKFAWILL